MPLFNKKTKSPVQQTTNKAGGSAFSMAPETELVHAVLTTFLDDKYYESGSDRKDRIAKLIDRCDPQFVTNLAVIARKEFHLRSVSHLLTGELAKEYGGEAIKNLVMDVTERPDDLMEIAAYVGTPMPKALKRGIRNAILKFSPYQLAKHKGEGRDYSMVDLFNLTHPKVQHASPEQAAAWDALMKGELKSFDTWETDVSNAGTEEGRKEAFENLILENKMGYMALIRNINNYIKYDISPKAKKAVIKKLTDPKEVARSKQLPFRFVTAFDNVKGDREYSDAISDAMDVAVSNVPDLGGKILIAVDASGSMGGDPIKKAAIFAATLMKANKNADIILYDTAVKEAAFSTKTPVIDIAKSIEQQAMGGGTNTGLVFEYAIQKKRVYDRIIIISDNESWKQGWHGTPEVAMKTYMAATGATPYVYAIDIQGYGTTDLKPSSKVFHLTGWSDRLLDFIGKVEQGETLVDYIKSYHKINHGKKIHDDTDGEAEEA